MLFGPMDITYEIVAIKIAQESSKVTRKLQNVIIVFGEQIHYCLG